MERKTMESKTMYNLKAIFSGESGYGNGIIQREKIDMDFTCISDVDNFIRTHPFIEEASGHGVYATLYLKSYKIYEIVTTLIKEEKDNGAH